MVGTGVGSEVVYLRLRLWVDEIGCDNHYRRKLFVEVSKSVLSRCGSSFSASAGKIPIERSAKLHNADYPATSGGMFAFGVCHCMDVV